MGVSSLLSVSVLPAVVVDGYRVLAVAAVLPVSVGTAGVGEGTGGGLAGLGVLAVLLFVAVALLVAWVTMAALSTFAVEGRLGAALELRSVGRLATSGPYVLAVVLAVVVWIALGMAVIAATVLTVGLALLVLIPLGAFRNVWTSLVTVYLFGAAYRETSGATSDGGATDRGATPAP